jgi:hypothetical protein
MKRSSNTASILVKTEKSLMTTNRHVGVGSTAPATPMFIQNQVKQCGCRLYGIEGAGALFVSTARSYLNYRIDSMGSRVW